MPRFPTLRSSGGLWASGRRFPEWEATPHTPVFFVRVARKGLTGALSVRVAGKGLKAAYFVVVARYFTRVANKGLMQKGWVRAGSWGQEAERHPIYYHRGMGIVKGIMQVADSRGDGISSANWSGRRRQGRSFGCARGSWGDIACDSAGARGSSAKWGRRSSNARRGRRTSLRLRRGDSWWT